MFCIEKQNNVTGDLGIRIEEDETISDSRSIPDQSYNTAS